MTIWLDGHDGLEDCARSEIAPTEDARYSVTEPPGHRHPVSSRYRPHPFAPEHSRPLSDRAYDAVPTTPA